MSVQNELLQNEVWQLFRPLQTVYFSTIDNNQPRVRPVTLFFFENRFWILTGTEDKKVAQIKTNLFTELCLPLPQEKDTGYIRISGRSSIINDNQTRIRIAENCPYFRNHWQETNDPGYTLIEIEAVEIEYMKPGDYLAKRIKI